MEAVVLVIHLMLALGLIVSILLQQSEGGGLGIGGSGGGGGMGGLATARGTANFLTRLTTILAISFFITTLSLAIIATNRSATTSGSILDMTDDPATLVPLARDGVQDDTMLADEAPDSNDEVVIEAEETQGDEIQRPAPTVPISE